MDACQSPESSFIIAIVIFLISIPFALQYVIHARFHRVAFVRNERVTKKMVMQAREVIAPLFKYVVRSRAERKRKLGYRILRTWGFLLWMIIVVFVVEITYFG